MRLVLELEIPWARVFFVAAGMAALAGLLVWIFRPRHLHVKPKTATRATVAKASANPEEETGIYVCQTRGPPADFDVAMLTGNATTLSELLTVACRAHGPKMFQGHKTLSGDLAWESFETFGRRVHHISAGLELVPRETIVAVYLQNCPEWTLVEHAAYANSCATVPLYDTLGAESAQFILNRTEAAVLVLGEAQLPKWREIEDQCPFVKRVVLVSRMPHRGTVLFSDVEHRGAHMTDARLTPPKPDDLATICFTSGTTGDPKGVMLTHRNMVSNLTSLIDRLRDLFDGSEHRHLSYLPLAHVLERILCNAALAVGARVAYNSNKDTLFDDLAAVRPTVFAGVPRVYDTIQQRVTKQLEREPAWKQWLFNTGLKVKARNQKYGVYSHSFWDTLIFGKIAQRLGGAVRVIISGAAPLDSDAIVMLRSLFSVPLLQAYGQTESTAAVSAATCDDPTVGHVGCPLSGMEVKLVTCKDLEFFARDLKGELCVRGPSVFQGYYKDPEKTAETIDEDGWLHTGDIATFDRPDGQLRIIDRKKALFKLAQGEYVAPEKLEAKYGKSPLVKQVFIPADPKKSCLVALVLPSSSSVTQEEGNPQQQLVLASFLTLKTVLKSFADIASESRLAGFEKIRAVGFLSEEMSEANGLLTSTMKLKRQAVEKKYAKETAEAYERAKQ
jgi:long-chain acyl-CoA synthetase